VKPEPKAEAPLVKFPPAPEAPVGAVGIQRLTYPCGLLGHVVQYFVDTAALPDRVMALAGALSALAKSLDGRVIGPTGNSTVLYMLLLAQTGARKQHILNGIRMTLRATASEKVIVASGLASLQAIEEIVEETPSALVLIDDVGSWLARIFSKAQTGNVSEIPRICQSLWGWPLGLEWVSTKKKGKEMTPVHNVAFAMFGASTENALFRTLKKKEVASGFVNRWVLWNVGRGALERVKPKYDWFAFPSWLAKALKAIAGEEPVKAEEIRLVLKAKDGNEVALRDYRRIGWEPGAEERWFAFEKRIRGLPSLEDRELWVRAPENAIRIATVLAVFRGSQVVEIEDLEWAIDVVEGSIRELVRGLDKFMIERLEQQELVERLRGEFWRKGMMTWGQIKKFCERKADLKMGTDAINYLIDCGDIVQLDPSTGPGRPTTKWAWSRTK
jgi:hypothetical protein